jgi:uncharacterized protein (TIGR02231 family)
MHKLVLLPAAILIAIGLHAQKKIDIKPDIKAVTVFHVGAEITSESKVSLPQGQHTIMLRGISKKVVSDNIRAYFESDKDGILLIKSSIAVDADTTWEEGKAGIVVKRSIRDSAVLLSSQLQKLTTEEQILSNQFELMKIKLGEVEMKSVEDATKLFDLYETRMIRLQTKTLSTRTQKNKISGLRNKYHNMASKHNPTGAVVRIKSIKRYHSLKLVVQANRAISGTLVVKYIVGATGWAPKYRLQANTENQKVDLRYMANVMNQSGKDWKNVNIKLSSAFPLEKIPNKPELSPWVLNTKHDARKYSSATVSKQNVKSEYSVDPLDNVEYIEADIPSVTQEFKIGAKQTILSDGEVFTLFVNDYTLPASFNYFAVPAMDNNSFLVAGLTDWESLYIINGKAEIVMNGTYIGDTYLDPRTLDDTLQITLGRDNMVMIEREEIEGEISKKEGNKIKQTFAFKNSIKNNSKQPNNVTVSDQIPISQISDVKVTIDELTGGDLDEATGIITWRATLKPKQKKEFVLKYTLEYPAAKARSISSGHKYKFKSSSKNRRSVPKFM